MDLCGEGHAGMLGVVVEDVVLHFVVGHEAEVAVRALTWFVVHDPIVEPSVRRRPGSKVRIERATPQASTVCQSTLNRSETGVPRNRRPLIDDTSSTSH